MVGTLKRVQAGVLETDNMAEALQRNWGPHGRKGHLYLQLFEKEESLTAGACNHTELGKELGAGSMTANRPWDENSLLKVRNPAPAVPQLAAYRQCLSGEPASVPERGKLLWSVVARIQQLDSNIHVYNAQL